MCQNNLYYNKNKTNWPRATMLYVYIQMLLTFWEHIENYTVPGHSVILWGIYQVLQQSLSSTAPLIWMFCCSLVTRVSLSSSMRTVGFGFQPAAEWMKPAFGPLSPPPIPSPPLSGLWIGELFVGRSWRCLSVKDISPGLLSTICLAPAARVGHHLGTAAMRHCTLCLKGGVD